MNVSKTKNPHEGKEGASAWGATKRFVGNQSKHGKSAMKGEENAGSIENCRYVDVEEKRKTQIENLNDGKESASTWKTDKA